MIRLLRYCETLPLILSASPFPGVREGIGYLIEVYACGGRPCRRFSRSCLPKRILSRVPFRIENYHFERIDAIILT